MHCFSFHVEFHLLTGLGLKYDFLFSLFSKRLEVFFNLLLTTLGKSIYKVLK